MLPFGVTIPDTVPQVSEIPEGLMNNPVHFNNFRLIRLACWRVIRCVISQSETKEQFLLLRKRNCDNLNVVTVTAVARSTSVRLSTAVTFRCGLAGSIETATRRRTGDCTSALECSSDVSSRLSDTAHNQAEQAGKQNYWLTVGKCLFTVDITYWR
jgi:hypothetical protein